MTRRSGFVLGAIASAMLALGGCAGGRAPRGKPPVPVRVATVRTATIPLEISAIGSVQPYQTVSVRAQVTGQITGVYFHQGQDVHAGELLFTLDPRPFQAILEQAEANLARDEAQADNARAELVRYATLYKEGGISDEQYQQFRTSAAAMAGTVQADQAQVDNARDQLAYTSIHAPIDGRTGSLLVDQGNLVQANATTPLVVINQVSPVYVAFSLPQQDLPEIQRYRTRGPLAVQAEPQGVPPQQATPSTGTLTFVDNAVDPTTGTIQLKATFENADRRLWPGQFLDVSTHLTDEPGRLIVPAGAVQTGQEGSYVFVVDHGTAQMQPVDVERSTPQVAVIASGLSAGQTVVTDGQVELYPGAKVMVAAPGRNRIRS